MPVFLIWLYRKLKNLITVVRPEKFVKLVTLKAFVPQTWNFMDIFRRLTFKISINGVMGLDLVKTWHFCQSKSGTFFVLLTHFLFTILPRKRKRRVGVFPVDLQAFVSLLEGSYFYSFLHKSLELCFTSNRNHCLIK